MNNLIAFLLCMALEVIAIPLTYAASDPSTPRIYFMDSSGNLKSANDQGGDEKQEFDPGVERRWHIIDFDLRADGRKAIVVSARLAEPDPNGFCDRTAGKKAILDLQSHTTETLTIHADAPSYYFQPLMRWSPNGQQIGYIQYDEVQTYDYSSKRSRQAGHSHVPDTSPWEGASRWSRGAFDFTWLSNDFIAAWNGRTSGSGIAFVSIINLKSNRSTEISENNCYTPTSGPANSVFWVRRSDTSGHIQSCHISPDGIAEQVADVKGTEGASSREEPFAWSADYTKLAFVTETLKTTHSSSGEVSYVTEKSLKAIDATSGELLIEIQEAHFPCWLNNDLLAQTKEGIVRVDVAKKQSKLLIPGGSLPERGGCIRWH